MVLSEVEAEAHYKSERIRARTIKWGRTKSLAPDLRTSLTHKLMKKEKLQSIAPEPSLILFKAAYFFSVALVPRAFLVTFLVPLGSLGGVGVLPGFSITALTS
jgi:hypothetical protein